jgi:hypothetical protein
MNIARKISIFSVCLLSLASFIIPAYAQNEAITESDAPIILKTTKILEDGQVYVSAKGLVKPNYDVLIYINGVYNGLANISQGNVNFSLFNYFSTKIKNANNTEIIAIARNQETHLLSSPSQAQVDSIIEKTSFSQPAPKETIGPTKHVVLAPILKTPQQKNCENKPYISGFSKNQTTVKIFIDNKLYINLPATSSVSEIAFFSYIPGVSLDRGQHSVYAVAEDKNGNLSPRSNLLTFCISNPQTISTSTSEEVELISDSIPTIEAGEADLVFQKTNPPEEATSTVLQKSKININLLLFGLFILIIIIWIIFVNKELLEENKDQNTKVE